MRGQRTRRQYLLSLGVASVAGLAGCSTDETEMPTETTTERSTQASLERIPDWAQWLPAEQFESSDDTLIAADLAGARQELPQDVYQGFGVADIADTLGIAETDMDTLIGLAGISASATVITGAYTPEAIRSTLEIEASETDTYQGFTVLSSELAVGESAIVTSDFRTVLDTKFGSTTAIGTSDEDWRTLLPLLTDGTAVFAHPGYTGGAELTVEPTHTGGTVDGTGGSAVNVTVHYLFAALDEATAVYENDRQQLRAQGDADGTNYTSVEREGRRIILSGTDEDFEA